VGVARANTADEARSLYEHGTALYALHRFAEAATQFEKAFELKPVPAILYNAAQAHRLAGNKARALELYQSYLRLFGGQPNTEEVRGHVRELQKAIDAEHRATTAPPAEPASIPPPRQTQAAAVDAKQPSDTTTLLVTGERTSRPLAKRPWFWATI